MQLFGNEQRGVNCESERWGLDYIERYIDCH